MAILHEATPLAGTPHATPHAPQLFTCSRSVSQPSFTFLLQSPQPYMQLPRPHTPLLQAAVALAGTGQTTPHAPQFLRSRETIASHPLSALLSQSEKPWLHDCSWHIAAWQASWALGATHSIPHAPQFLASELRSCSQPLSTLPSQSPKLALHLPTPHDPA